jgi:hypothetical protein
MPPARVPQESGAIAFAERVLTLLDDGSFTATYKYAVLLGLIDLCMEGVSATTRGPWDRDRRTVASAPRAHGSSPSPEHRDGAQG